MAAENGEAVFKGRETKKICDFLELSLSSIGPVSML
jgi:hypothetical protein